MQGDTLSLNKRENCNACIAYKGKKKMYYILYMVHWIILVNAKSLECTFQFSCQEVVISLSISSCAHSSYALIYGKGITCE